MTKEYFRRYYQEHKEQASKRGKNYRASLRLLHRCTRCGKADDRTLEGHAVCAVCLEYAANQRQKKRATG